MRAIFVNSIKEGVGDKFAQSRFNIPDPDEEFEKEYGYYKAEKSKNYEQIIKTGIIKGDEEITIIKNPKSLSGFDEYCRGIIDTRGNLFVSPNGTAYWVHDSMVKYLKRTPFVWTEEEIIKAEYTEEFILWHKIKPRSFLTVQRYGNTNYIMIGESNEDATEIADLYYENYEKLSSDPPEMWHQLEPDMESSYYGFMKNASIKNPNLTFIAWPVFRKYQIDKLGEKKLMKKLEKNGLIF